MSQPGELISVSELQHLLESDSCRVVDCRFDLFDRDKGRQEYLAGHIPGAVYADMDRDLASEVKPDTGRHPLPEVGEFQSTLAKWGIGNRTRVVAYDSGNGSLAVRLWWMLRWLGHERVSVLDGGLSAWTGAGLPTETREPDYPTAEFCPSPDASMIVTTEEIAQALADGSGLCLIDARDAARFRGDKEPIDSVAGRIPGARNLPFARNLDGDGKWRSPAELAALWKEVVSDEQGSDVTVMCGSGVTACHLILSAAQAGRAMPRLYVGSWSEWIRDENRPVARGD